MTDEVEETPDPQPGLRPFMHETLCPKCASTGVRTEYHPTVIISMSGFQFPCVSWLRAGVLSPEVGQHLCLRCMRCGYGWPTRTADVAPVQGLEDDG